MTGRPTPQPAFGSAKKGSHTQKMAVTATMIAKMINPRLVALMEPSLMTVDKDGSILSRTNLLIITVYNFTRTDETTDQNCLLHRGISPRLVQLICLMSAEKSA